MFSVPSLFHYQRTYTQPRASPHHWLETISERKKSSADKKPSVNWLRNTKFTIQHFPYPQPAGLQKGGEKRPTVGRLAAQLGEEKTNCWEVERPHFLPFLTRRGGRQTFLPLLVSGTELPYATFTALIPGTPLMLYSSGNFKLHPSKVSFKTGGTSSPNGQKAYTEPSSSTPPPSHELAATHSTCSRAKTGWVAGKTGLLYQHCSNLDMSCSNICCVTCFMNIL